MATFVPLISSGTAGPLGVLHLPRLWLKASLELRGKLDPRYPGAGKGYDQMTIDSLGLPGPFRSTSDAQGWCGPLAGGAVNGCE